MEEPLPQSELALDTKVLSEFIYALNIARRQVQAYPAGHSMIETAVDKLLRLLMQLLEFRYEITFGIARDSLLVNGQSLDSTDPVFCDFARHLYNAGFASLTINANTNTDEICRFFRALNQTERRQAEPHTASRAPCCDNFLGIQAKGLDYGAFHTTESNAVHAPKPRLAKDDSTALWKSFVNALISGTLDPEGQKLPSEQKLDPSLLAEILNGRETTESTRIARNYDDAITSFLKQADRDQLRSQTCQESLARLAKLVDRLSPQLRRRFLTSTLTSCADNQQSAAAFLSHLPQSRILEALEQTEEGSLSVPQAIIDLLGIFAQQGGASSDARQIVGTRPTSPRESQVLLGHLFNTDHTEQYVPPGYQKALAVLARTENNAVFLPPEQLQTLLPDLEGHAVETQFCQVMIALIDQGIDAATARRVNLNLEELILYFLEIGDFTSLSDLHTQLTRHASQLEAQLGSPEISARQIFTSEDFTTEVLNGLDNWGKPKFVPIKQLIKNVGTAFAAPLLERLAVENDMGKRRLLMECLQILGPEARDQIVAQLHDRRWFFVRNLVILLRKMNDSSVLEPLGRLIGYNNSKVQLEVMLTFLEFNDPRAERYLLKELDSEDAECVLNAARLASKSDSPAVARKLADLLNNKLPKEVDAAIKKAVIDTLSKMALPEALPGLELFLLNRRLRQSFQKNSLRIAAVQALENFNDPAAALLAAEVKARSFGEMARIAGEVSRKLNGRLL